jgi:hypothetical protein
MKSIKFTEHILPHLVAIAAFFVVTVLFFKPYFFDNKVITQGDIQQAEGSSKTIADYRKQTGEEALWADGMFSGMPAYMISVQWSNGPVNILKRIVSVGISHPVTNIFCAFIGYYILLLAFGVRPYLAIGGAVAFGLSSYMILGLSAGHNGRIGAIAFMPLVIAGVHLAFSGRRILGFGVTAAGLALHLRENHVQITYYLAIVVVAYVIIQLVIFLRNKQAIDFFKTAAMLAVAGALAAGTYFGQFWALTEYSKYSIRGKSDLVKPGAQTGQSGLGKDYAFAYRYGILEPMTLLIPEFYGGSSMNVLAADQKSATYQALVRASNNEQAQQLANMGRGYWGPQDFTGGPYYAGAIIIFLFVLGMLFAPRRYVVWLVPLSILSLMLSWGDSFSSFNYFVFDYVPGYNKFRSVNFALVIILLAMPLLGLIGLERLLTLGITKETRKKLIIAAGATGGLCLLIMLFAGLASFQQAGEEQFPLWFLDALREDRKGLLRADAFRSLAFIAIIFALLLFKLPQRVSMVGFCAVLSLMITFDIAFVDKRYFTEANFQRKTSNPFQGPTEADQEILKDKSYYRVYYLPQNPLGSFTEARTSYFHHSIGGYHGAKIRRYQDLYDSCFLKQTLAFVDDIRGGNLDWRKYGSINMLNIKYIMYGPAADNIIPNPAASGPAWFVRDVQKVKSANDELSSVCAVNTLETAVIDESQFTVPAFNYDSTATIQLVKQDPRHLTYQTESGTNGLAVFSEIYYPAGWNATIDGNPVDIMRADYVLRALPIPAGKHTVAFSFDPKAYTVGNKVTAACSWIVLLVLLGSIGYSLKAATSHEPRASSKS